MIPVPVSELLLYDLDNEPDSALDYQALEELCDLFEKMFSLTL